MKVFPAGLTPSLPDGAVILTAEEVVEIRADERARTVREVVEWIRHVVACGDGTEAFAGIFAVYRLETANKIADTIERGEYKEGKSDVL